MIPIISFVGQSNSGKTTLLEKVVEELKIRGYRVAVVKHSPHGFDMDHPGKDSWRLTQAGSDIVALSSPNKVAFVERLEKELTLAQIRILFETKVDIVLAEGYKNGDAAKILVLATEQDKEWLCREEKPLATVSARLSSLGMLQFDDDDVTHVTDLLITYIGKDSSDNVTDVTREVSSTPRHDSHKSKQFEDLLAESASVHGHICPGQVLGVRMAMLGLKELGIKEPKEDPKRMVVYVETDRCATDAIQVVTGCKLGKRTMKHMDYGKMAATFVDLKEGTAVRVVAREDVRQKAALRQSEGCTKYEAQLSAYKEMPDDELFNMEYVQVKIPTEDMPGLPHRRVICDQCGEGVNDGRDVMLAGRILCRSCAYGGYYQRYEALVK